MAREIKKILAAVLAIGLCCPVGASAVRAAEEGSAAAEGLSGDEVMAGAAVAMARRAGRLAAMLADAENATAAGVPDACKPYMADVTRLESEAPSSVTHYSDAGTYMMDMLEAEENTVLADPEVEGMAAASVGSILNASLGDTSALAAMSICTVSDFAVLPVGLDKPEVFILSYGAGEESQGGAYVCLLPCSDGIVQLSVTPLAVPGEDAAEGTMADAVLGEGTVLDDPEFLSLAFAEGEQVLMEAEREDVTPDKAYLLGLADALTSRLSAERAENLTELFTSEPEISGLASKIRAAMEGDPKAVSVYRRPAGRMGELEEQSASEELDAYLEENVAQRAVMELNADGGAEKLAAGSIFSSIARTYAAVFPAPLDWSEDTILLLDYGTVSVAMAAVENDYGLLKVTFVPFWPEGEENADASLAAVGFEKEE